MDLNIEFILLAASILLILSILSSKLSEKIGVPALLFFLIIGMVAGSDGPGGIYFDSPHITQFIGMLALISILFSGGLDSQWTSVKPVLWSGLALSTIAVVITASLICALTFYTLNLSFKECFLIGAIVSSTDAAAVFATFKSSRSYIKSKLVTLIQFESASNDPMAVLLTLWTIKLFITPTISVAEIVVMLIQQIVFGTVVGCVMGKIIPLIIDKINLEHRGLYPVLTIALVLFTYSATAFLGGSGYLAVFLTGLVMGNQQFKYKKHLIQFHDSITWLMQIMVFLALGLLVFPSQLMNVLAIDLLISFFLMLFIRPISVFVTLLFSNFQFREKLMISWMGLRGAVPIILATFPMVAQIPKSTVFFHIVFFVVLTSILIQGISMPYVAKWLKVNE